MKKQSHKITAETEHYILYKCHFDAYYGGQDMHNHVNRHLTLNILEEIHAQGYRPIFYENRQNGFVCEKSLIQVKEWNDKQKSAKAA